MIHHEPWFSCDQCGRAVPIPLLEGLKEEKHFCDKHCKAIYEHKAFLLKNMEEYKNLSK